MQLRQNLVSKLLALGFTALLATAVSAQEILTPEQLLERVRADKASEQQLMQEREQRFLADKNQQQSIYQQAMTELRQQEAEAAELKKLFQQQEQQLAEQEQLLKTRMGELGELFAVLRQSASDLAGQWQGSMLNVQQPERINHLERFAASRKLPSAAEIEQLWLLLLEDMTASAQVQSFTAPVISANGQRTDLKVTRAGVFSAYSDTDFLVYQAGDDALRALPRQPGGLGAVKKWLASSSELASIPVDPTRGSLLEQLQQQPRFFDRVKQGGLVGWVIISLGAMGFILAFWRLFELQQVVMSIKQQMCSLGQPNANNPLGRVLSVLGDKPQLNDLETLELKLDEAVMQEVPRLERGQGLLKLLAAVAPLLGLLGTVTGMIITFQAITQAGGGDSRLMADGISQALVTTVQGLVVAIPLLFLHSVLAARSKGVVQLLEQQCVGLLALQMSSRDSRD